MNQFSHVKAYPDVYQAVMEVNRRINMQDWDVALQKMRTAAELMLNRIYSLYDDSQQLPDLFTKIKQLGDANLIAPASVSNYHLIRDYGNHSSHENAGYGPADAQRCYRALVQETLLFAERYMAEIDPDGRRRLKAVAGKVKGRGENRRYPKWQVRCVGVFYMVVSVLFAAFGLSVLGNSTSNYIFTISIFAILWGVFCLAFFITGLYAFITGDERVMVDQVDVRYR